MTIKYNIHDKKVFMYRQGIKTIDGIIGGIPHTPLSNFEKCDGIEINFVFRIINHTNNYILLSDLQLVFLKDDNVIESLYLVNKNTRVNFDQQIKINGKSIFRVELVKIIQNPNKDINDSNKIIIDYKINSKEINQILFEFENLDILNESLNK